MTRNLLAVAAVFLLPALARADEYQHLHDHHKIEKEAVPPNDPPIKITINPETRVSVTLSGALPPPAPCGTAADLLVRVVNQGFITGQLEAELTGDMPDGVTLGFQPAPLKGVAEELRKLHITLMNPGPTDLSLVFRAKNEIPDLGGRDRVHFLMDCLPVHVE
jgi:hypothetical protein